MFSKKRVTAAGVAIAASFAVVPAAFAADDLKVKPVVFDDLILVSVASADASATVSVVAEVDGGSGKGSVRATTSGHAFVAFQAPDGFSGTVRLATTSGNETVLSVLDVAPVAAEPTTTTSSTVAPVTSSSVAPSTSTTAAAPTSTTKAPSTTSTTKVASAALPSTIKLMAVGDSITQGGNSTGSYRKFLHPQLNSIAGTKWDFVGGEHDNAGVSPDGDHEGYSGKTNEWLAGIAQKQVSTYKPDVVLIHGGTNDILYGKTGPQAADFLRQLITNTYKGKSDTHIVVAGIIPLYEGPKAYTSINPTSLANMTAYQKLVPQVVAEFKAQGKSIAYVDMYSVFSASYMQTDGVHLEGPAGNQKMAEVFYPAIKTWVEAH